MRSLPEADIPYAGLRGWVGRSDQGQTVFHAADAELIVSEHTHDSQWGIVISGRIDFIVAGQTWTYNRGDTYIIPAGLPHAGHIYPGFRSVDYFGAPDHYKVR